MTTQLFPQKIRLTSVESGTSQVWDLTEDFDENFAVFAFDRRSELFTLA